MALYAGIKFLSVAVLVFCISIEVNDAKKVSCTIFYIRTVLYGTYMCTDRIFNELILVEK